jgi:ribosomal protein S18 acetylase RimI-like enzyme
VREAPPILIREAQVDDLPLVTHSWKQSQRKRLEWRWIPDDHYYPAMDSRINLLLQHSHLLIAALDTDDAADLITGWMCHDKDAVHYCYVKEAYRRYGIAKRLLRESGLMAQNVIRCTHWSPLCESLAVVRVSPRLVYAPSLAYVS